MNQVRHAIIVTVLLVLASTAEGKTLYVPTAAYHTIQAAIDAAASGDRIAVAPGMYTENINFLGKAIHLHSQSRDPEDTTIQGTGSGSVVTCNSGEASATILEGFTITGGSWPWVGVYVEWSDLTVTNCTFSDNSGGGMDSAWGYITVTDCTFSDNAGTGIFSYGGSVTVTDCTFSNNHLGMVGAWSTSNVTDCAFTDNSYAGMANYNEIMQTIAQCIFKGNGVGIWNGEDADVVVNDCLFSDNSGDGMHNVDCSPLTHNCAFIDNGGHGMYNIISPGTVTNCAFMDNSGSGMYNDEYSTPTVVNCIFVGNSGPGMHNQYIVSDSRSLTVTNCTFLDNADGGICNTYTGPEVTNCILWSNACGPIVGDPGTVTYSDVEGGLAGEGNIDADPSFVDVNGGDLHLAPGSPCIDAGTNSPTGGLPSTDIEGNPRPVDGDHDGVAVADMGAYEAPGKRLPTRK